MLSILRLESELRMLDNFILIMRSDQVRLAFLLRRNWFSTGSKARSVFLMACSISLFSCCSTNSLTASTAWFSSASEGYLLL